jgi:hypothetical protein
MSKWSSIAPLPRPGHNDDVLDARRNRLFHAVLQMGLSTRASISLGITLVAGKNRVPRPPAGNCLPNPFAHPVSFI